MVADLDLRPARRSLVAASLCGALNATISGSEAGLRGSLASGAADRYSDVDICWVVPDDGFARAVDSAARAVESVHAVSSLRIDPDLARSELRRLIFIRLEGLPLFWRIDLDVRARSVAADDNYDAVSRAASIEAGWSRPASAIENAVAAIKAVVRHRASAASGLLCRGYERIDLDPGSATDLPGMITRLADSCAVLEPGLAATAEEVREVVKHLVQAELLPLKLSD